MLTFRKISYIAAVAAAGVIGANAASAATYNFESTSVTESGVADGTVIDTGAIDGLQLAGLAGYDFDNVADTITGKGNFAYLDGPSGRLAGGLGVCSVLNGGDQCNPSSDDNVTVGEAVGINFGTGNLTSVIFRGTTIGGTNSHQLLADGSTFLFSLNGLDFKQGTVGAGGVWDATGGAGLALINGTGIFFAVDNYEFYIASAEYNGGPPDGGPNPVPLPAGGLLLLTALGGLGVARKRAKKS
jgi:hypothetical protein